MAISESNLLLIATYNNPDWKLAYENGHKTIVPINRDDIVSKACVIDLPKVSFEEARDAISEFFKDYKKDYIHNHTEVDKLASFAKKNMGSFIRSQTINYHVISSEWSNDSNKNLITLLSLVGTFTYKDKNIITDLVETDLEDIEFILNSYKDDPPLIKSGNKWTVTSSYDILRMLLNNINQKDLYAFRDFAKKELNNINISQELQKGLAKSFVVIKKLHKDDPGSYSQLPMIVDSILISTYESMFSADGKLWEYNSDIFRLFAEASPNLYLNFVEKILNEDLPQAQFNQVVIKNFFGNNSHISFNTILGLELLMWSKEFFEDSAKLLIEIIRKYPETQTFKEAERTLIKMLSIYINNTSAPISSRVKVIEYFSKIAPLEAWQTVIKIWPQPNMFFEMPSGPYMHIEWKPEESYPGHTDYTKGMDKMVEILLNIIESNPKLWPDIFIKKLDFDFNARDKILTHLISDIDKNKIDNDTKKILWKEFSEILDSNKNDSSLLKNDLNDILLLLEPDDEYKFIDLFSYNPFVPEAYGHSEEYQNELEKRREALLAKIIENNQFNNLKPLILKIENSNVAGHLLAKISEKKYLANILLLENDLSSKQFALSWINQNIKYDAQWPMTFIENNWKENQYFCELMFQFIPKNIVTWEKLKQIDHSAYVRYWGTVDFNHYFLDSEDLEKAIEELLSIDRFETATKLFATYLDQNHSKSTNIFADKLIIILLDALKNHIELDANSIDYSQIKYYLKALFRYLHKNIVDSRMVAGYEIFFYKFLNNYDMKALHLELEKSPEFYVECIKEIVNNNLDEQIILGWYELPGLKMGDFDSNKFSSWLNKVSTLAIELHIIEYVNQFLGYLIASNHDNHKGWSRPELNDLIEKDLKNDFVKGIRKNVMFSPNTVIKGVFSGGDIERRLASEYIGYANNLKLEYPKLSNSMKEISDFYLQQAKEEDAESEELSTSF